jgi:hypothetical protein
MIEWEGTLRVREKPRVKVFFIMAEYHNRGDEASHRARGHEESYFGIVSVCGCLARILAGTR